jgi:hypothetical protein
LFLNCQSLFNRKLLYFKRRQANLGQKYLNILMTFWDNPF